MMRAVQGLPALCMALIAWLVMSVVAIGTPYDLPGCSGTLIDAPQCWQLSTASSYLLNLLLTGSCALALWVINKNYNVLPGPAGVYVALFITACGANPLLDRQLNGGMLAAAITLAGIAILFSLHGRRHAPMSCLMLFSLIGWGSMLQSCCVLLAPVFLLGVLLLRSLRLRELLASIIGLILPYWIICGLGIASLSDINMPELLLVSHIEGEPAAVLHSLLSAAIPAFIMLLLIAYNAMNSASEGVKMIAYHSFINLLGLCCILFICIDVSRIAAYSAILYICLAFITARSFRMARSPRAWVLPVVIWAIFILLFFALL